MPLVRMYKNRQNQKRSIKLKGRPLWQDVVPETKQGRDAYAIADKFQGRFSRAFMKATREVLDARGLRARFIEAYNSGSVAAVEQALPFFEEGATDELPVWESFMTSMMSAYGDVIQAAGKQAISEANKKYKMNVRFTLDTAEDVSAKAGKTEILKAAASAQTEALKVPMVPVNPYSIEWMRNRSLMLVKQGVNKAQREVVREVLLDGFERGLRAEEAYATIKQNIGLTKREYGAVRNRRKLLEEQGFTKPQIEAQANKYTEQLTKKRAERIARTETIKAQAQGRSDSWRLAQESGQLPAVERVWLTPPETANPNAPCEICTGLDGETAPIGEPYHSDIIGPVMGPGDSHPGCRCAETIRRVK
jgi:hypothetical protein